eukprot:6193739-Pleurochrysis_carterae.AAC.4
MEGCKSAVERGKSKINLPISCSKPFERRNGEASQELILDMEGCKQYMVHERNRNMRHSHGTIQSRHKVLNKPEW